MSGQLLSRREVTFTNFKDALSNNQPRYTLVGSGNHFYKYPYTLISNLYGIGKWAFP
jgi:hypothetical protein